MTVERQPGAEVPEDVYERHGRALYGTALRILGRPEEAEDAMQETFLRYHRERGRLDPAQLGGWLRRVVVNECIDRVRRRRRWGEGSLPEAALRSPERRPSAVLDLRRAVARLPERARLVFLLHDVEGLPHHEVGESLGISAGSSKSQLFRARRLLRGYLEHKT